MRISGWRIAGNIPNVPKYVLIVAPHTSNWDFFHGFCAFLVLRLDNTWLAKHTVFFWPLGILARRFGGMPIDRAKGGNVVRTCVSEFARRERISFTITPEGTRGKVKEWKLGFYYIATEAGVPIVPVALELFEEARDDHGAVLPDRRRGRRSAEDQGAVFGRAWRRHPREFLNCIAASIAGAVGFRGRRPRARGAGHRSGRAGGHPPLDATHVDLLVAGAEGFPEALRRAIHQARGEAAAALVVPLREIRPAEPRFAASANSSAPPRSSTRAS